MRVVEIMSPNVRVASPDHTVAQAARAMAEIDVGILLIQDGHKLVGVLTDRDIVVRALAAQKGPDTKLRDLMTENVRCCVEDQSVAEAASIMMDERVRRLPVLSRAGLLVGIVSLSDIAECRGYGMTGDTLRHICRAGGRHSQTSARHGAS